MTADFNVFKKLYEFATVGILAIDASGKITMMNPHALELFGYKENEIIGQQLEVLLPEKFLFNHIKLRQEYMEAPVNRLMGIGKTLYARRIDGVKFPVEVSLSHYDNNGNRTAIAFISDITQRIAAEDELRKLNSHLEQIVMERTDKLEKALEEAKEISAMKSSLISMASHEFRTPLTTIMSSSLLIKRLQELDRLSDTQKHFNKIDTAINRITAILNDFLAIDRVEENKVELQLVEFSIEELLNDCIEELHILESEGQTVDFVHDGEKLIMHDKSVLHNILSNLISNALKYSEKTVYVRSKVTDSELSISIKDQGRGIPEADLETIYEKFHRASNVGTVQGTGLGLNIVKKYADLLNGTLSFKSELNVGTECTITIPLQNNQPS